MKNIYIVIGFFLLSFQLHSQSQSTGASNSTGTTTIVKEAPQQGSIQSGERFNYTITFQNLDNNNTLVITDLLPAGLCLVASDVRANNAFVDFNGAAIPNPGSIPNLIDTSALPLITFNIPNNIRNGSFTVIVSFCEGVTPNGFTVTNNICGAYTSNGSTENFCTTTGVTNTASAVSPWGNITKEAILPAVADAAGNTFVSTTAGIANYRIRVSKLAAFQGTVFGMLNLEDVSITEIASPPCAVVSLVSGPGTYNSATGQIEFTNDLIGYEPFFEIEFIVQVDYGPCGALAEGQVLSNRVELNGTPAGGNPQNDIANDTSTVTATGTLPAPTLSAAVLKTVLARNPVAGCQGRYDLQFFNSDNRAIAPYEIIDIIPAGLIADSYQVNGSLSSLGVNRSFDVFINGALDRSFTLPDDNFTRFPWNGASGDVLRIVAQNGTEIYPGDFLDVNIFFNIDASVTPGTLITNCVDFTGELLLSDAADIPITNQSCIDILIEAPSIDVCVAKNVRVANTPDPFTNSITNVAPSDEVEFQICVQNNGSLDFNGRMEDVLDPKYEFISVDNTGMPAGTTFTQTGQNLVWNNLDILQTCDVFSIDNGCAIQDTFFCATVRARVRPFTLAGNIDNSASLIENSGTLQAISDFAKVNVIEISVFSVNKEVSLDNITFQSTPLVLDPNCDSIIYYRIRVENIGNKDATSFLLFDELPFSGDVLYPTNLSRGSTFSFNDITTTSADFNISYTTVVPSFSIAPSNFNCSNVAAGNPTFIPFNSRTIRLENNRDLNNTDTFEVIIQATLPSNNLTSNDQAVNSAYVINCDVSSGIIASSSVTNPAIIDIEKLVEAGFDGTLDVCSAGNPLDIFNAIPGQPDTGGTWTPALASGGNIFDPAIDTAGLYTYTVTTTPSCATDSSELTISITTQRDPGQDGDLVLCSTDAAVNLFNSINGTPENGGVWTPVLSSGTGLFNPAIDPAGTYTYTIPALNSCPAISSNVTVTVNTAANAGLDNTIDLCSTGASVDLNTLLLGTPEAGGIWTPTLNSGTSFFDPTIDLAGIYIYTITGLAPCADDTAQLDIIITNTPDPGTDGTVDICANANPIDLFLSLNGAPQTGGTWSPVLNSNSGIFDPTIDLAGIYTYTLPALGPCAAVSAVVDVNITPAPDPGIDAIVNLCNSSLPLDLITILNGTPDAGGTWSPALNSNSGLFDPAIDTAGTYTYTVSRNECMDESSTVLVSFNDAVVISSGIDIELCDETGANDGSTLFDISINEVLILDGLDPLEHTITYHSSNMDALDGTNSLNTSYTNTNISETIHVRVENNLTNCFATTTFNLTGLLLPDPQLLGEYEACFSETGIPINPSRLPILDTQLSNALYDFQWFFNGNLITGNTDPELRVDALGDYSVIVTNRTTGCLTTQETTVLQEDYLMAQAVLVTNQFSNDPIIEVNVLNNTGDTYWYSLDNGPWQASNRFENVEQGMRHIRVKGANSCGVATDSILVLRYPRFFTPNNDGFNDYWQIKDLENTQSELYIFDRYGKLLKQLDLTSIGWDGMYLGNPLPSSDYWFKLDYIDPNTGEVAQLKSHFSLKR